VQELENFIERFVIVSSDPNLALRWRNCGRGMGNDRGPFTLKKNGEGLHPTCSGKTGSVISTAAIRLGMPRNILNAMVKKAGDLSQGSLTWPAA
jgi:hypothetical protein